MEPSGEEKVLSVREAYAQLWRVIKLPAVRRLSIILLTFRHAHILQIHCRNICTAASSCNDMVLLLVA